uniref:Aminotransferase-like plant mobile domain-containing protein n=1 Tax=Fagus sylvatica TaxID=28930 RepID=A0A2N9G8X1_FAGSY
MASSSNDPDSLVTLHFHDFHVERMRHWWTLLGEGDHADIVGIFGKFPSLMRLQVDRGLLEALASFWDPTHCCFSYWGGGSCPYLRGSCVPRSPDRRKTWRKANISLDLLTRYFSRSDFPVELARDFIAGKQGMEEIPNQRLQDCLRRGRGEGVPMFCTQLLQLWFCSHLRHFYRLQTPYHFERHTVSQAVKIALPFTGNSCDWALFLLDLPLGEWLLSQPSPFVSLAVFSTHLRLGDLDAVTFDYIPGEDMWRLLSRIEVIWEGRLSEVVLIEDGSPGDSSVTSDFVEWREGWTPFFTLRPTVRPGASYSLVSRSLRVSGSTGQYERAAVLERELRGGSGRAVITTPCQVRRWRTFAATWRLQRRNVSTLRAMNEFIREQLEISEDAKDQLEETLAETREQLETEQDIVALRRALDASEEALTSARTSMGAMRVQISVLQGDNGVLQTELDLVHDALESNASWLNQEGFPVVTALHQINQVMELFGCPGSRHLGGA